MLRAVTLLLLIGVAHAASGSYNYDDPDNDWQGECATGSKQSPIDVITPSENEAGLWSEKAYSLTMDDGVKATFVEKSHTVFYDISGNGNHYVLDPTSEKVCQIHQLHFHWGADSTMGSEHHLDGKTYASELHLVTQRQGINSTEYVVFNRFLEEGHADNAELEKMIFEQDVDNMDLSALYPSSIGSILTYPGSLTTPGCNEIVTWVIISEPLEISTRQAELLRDWEYNGTKIGNTHRPVQPLNGRTIKGIKFTAEEDNNTDINTDDDNKEDGECKRGYFNWEGKCNQCPPGQSTVSTGASYEDCIGERYISCKWEVSYNPPMAKMYCMHEHCPCTAYEYCEDGQCIAQAYNSSVVGVSGSVMVTMVTALYALF